MQRIGVLGASFDPPTRGHQDVILQALPFFDEILLVPSVSHAFGKSLSPLKHRLQMLEIFLAIQNEEVKKMVKISNIEEKMQKMHAKGAPIYTFDVLSTLTHLYDSFQKEFQLRFILGPDNMSPLVWQKFYRYQEIEQNWPLFIAEERIAIHSTMVRETVSKYHYSAEILLSKLLDLVDEPIAHYILQHHLYADKGASHE